jgi:hypothetical protein
VRQVRVDADSVLASEVEEAVELAGVNAFGVEVVIVLSGVEGLAGIGDPAEQFVGERVHGLRPEPAVS